MSTSFQEQLFDARWYQTSRGWFAFFLLIVLTLIHIPFLLLFEKLFKKSERGFLWMAIGAEIIQFYLLLAGVKIEVIGTRSGIPMPVVYAGNHLTFMDGLILNTIFGPRLVILTAPDAFFPFPFSFWFKRDATVEISRDEYDAAHFNGGTDRQAALDQLIKRLKEGVSVLIFPEGHYEKTEQLHYIHTGVARVAIRSQTPVQLITTTYQKRIFLSHYRVRPGTLTITIGPLILSPTVSKTLLFRDATLQLRQEILSGLEQMLPSQFLPDYLTQARQENIAAFFDLDRTIYAHFSQKDFFRFLIKNGEVSQSEVIRFFLLSLQAKTGLLNDRQMAERCYTFFTGRTVKEIQDMTLAFYEEVMPKNLEKNILPYIKDHQETNHQLVLVTAVPHPLSCLFADHFQMRCLDTELEIIDGCYTGRVTCFMDGRQKTHAVKTCALQQKIDLDKSYAYADSWSDYGMLHCVRYPVAVNPDARLRQKAEEKKWKVLT